MPPLTDLYTWALSEPFGGPGDAGRPLLASMIVPAGYAFAVEATPIDSSGGGGGGSTDITVTVVLLGSDADYSYTGFDDGTFFTAGGAVSPASLNGAAFVSTYYALHGPIPPGDNYWIVALAGTLAQDFWTSVTDGVTTLLSADADTFTQAGPYTLWKFLNPSTAFWFSPGTANITFTF